MTNLVKKIFLTLAIGTIVGSSLFSMENKPKKFSLVKKNYSKNRYDKFLNGFQLKSLQDSIVYTKILDFVNQYNTRFLGSSCTETPEGFIKNFIKKNQDDDKLLLYFLRSAIENDLDEMVVFFIKLKGLQYKSTNRDKNSLFYLSSTLFHRALVHGSGNVVNKVIESIILRYDKEKLRLYIINNNVTPLHSVAYYGKLSKDNIKVLSAFLDKIKKIFGQDFVNQYINTVWEKTHATPLMFAELRGNLGIAKIFKKYGACHIKYQEKSVKRFKQNRIRGKYKSRL